MASSRQTSQPRCNHYSYAGKRPGHLSSTIEKLARAGEQAGFSVEKMIEMLNAGVTIGALLDMISYSLSREALGIYPSAVEESTSAGARAHTGAQWRKHPWIA